MDKKVCLICKAQYPIGRSWLEIDGVLIHHCKVLKDEEQLEVLLKGCPHGKPADDCPLNSYRRMSQKEQQEYIKSLSKKEKEDLVQHHYDCNRKREYDFYKKWNRKFIKNGIGNL